MESAKGMVEIEAEKYVDALKAESRKGFGGVRESFVKETFADLVQLVGREERALELCDGIMTPLFCDILKIRKAA